MTVRGSVLSTLVTSQKFRPPSETSRRPSESISSGG